MLTPETIDKIAEALSIRPSVLFDEFGSPEVINSTFRKIYGTSLKEELSNRILKDIEEVCDRI